VAKSIKSGEENAKDIEDAVEVVPSSDPIETESMAEKASDPAPDPIEDIAEPSPQPVIEPRPEPAPVVVQRRGGFFPTLLGGVVAAGVGAGAALYLFPDGLNGQATAPADGALAGSVKTQGDAIDTLKGDLASLRADVGGIIDAAKAQPESSAALQDLQARVTELSDGLGQLSTHLSDLSARVDAIGNAAPVVTGGTDGGVPGDAAALAPQLAEMRQLIEQQKAQAAATEERLGKVAENAEQRLKEAEDEATRLRTEAETAARDASMRAALSHLQAAMESGAPIRPALDDLTKAGATVPQALIDQQDGVPTLGALQAGFPDAARAALTLSLRETAGDSTMSRLWAFLRAESGARSLSPRAGDDPDAILSRAEAATKAGDLAAAVKEIGTLPPDGRARMAEWVALAERRLSAEAAVAQLTQTLN
jgi:hypothetical protein